VDVYRGIFYYGGVLAVISCCAHTIYSGQGKSRGPNVNLVNLVPALAPNRSESL
jgi:hypothetical protein